MRYYPVLSTSKDDVQLIVERAPNWIVWLSGLYDWADHWLTGYMLCNTRFRAWLYKMEDAKAERFSVQLDEDQHKAFYAYMKWVWNEDD